MLVLSVCCDLVVHLKSPKILLLFLVLHVWLWFRPLSVFFLLQVLWVYVIIKIKLLTSVAAMFAAVAMSFIVVVCCCCQLFAVLFFLYIRFIDCHCLLHVALLVSSNRFLMIPTFAPYLNTLPKFERAFFAALHSIVVNCRRCRRRRCQCRCCLPIIDICGSV